MNDTGLSEELSLFASDKFEIVSVVAFGVDATHGVAKCLADSGLWGRCIGLSGELGAGKTEFVRGLMRALGSDTDVASPTYVLEHVYAPDINLPEKSELNNTSEKTVHHWDLYRVGSSYQDGDLLDIVNDISKIVLIEWPELVDWVLSLLDIHVQLRLLSTKECTEYSAKYSPELLRNVSSSDAICDEMRVITIVSPKIMEISKRLSSVSNAYNAYTVSED